MTLAIVRSHTDPSKTYDIRVGRDGVVYCTCPAWRYQRLPAAARNCKHMRGVARMLAAKAA